MPVRREICTSPARRQDCRGSAWSLCRGAPPAARASDTPRGACWRCRYPPRCHEVRRGSESPRPRELHIEQRTRRSDIHGHAVLGFPQLEVQIRRSVARQASTPEVPRPSTTTTVTAAATLVAILQLFTTERRPLGAKRHAVERRKEKGERRRHGRPRRPRKENHRKWRADVRQLPRGRYGATRPRTPEGQRSRPRAGSGSSPFTFLLSPFYPRATRMCAGAGYCPPVHAVDLPMRLRA